jgi:hypothetical protein
MRDVERGGGRQKKQDKKTKRTEMGRKRTCMQKIRG